MSQQDTQHFTGDDLIPDAAMVYDQRRLIKAAPRDVWPWVVQLGKGRGGWYLPSSWERLLPASWHAAHAINPAWQGLAVGDRVLDYGFNAAEDVFDVVIIEDNRALVYRSERYGTVFTWALLLETPDDGGSSSSSGTVLHLRFRGRIQKTGWKRKLLVWGGGLMDHWTTAPMLTGLAERAEKTQ